jgi:hypothetical protein
VVPQRCYRCRHSRRALRTLHQAGGASGARYLLPSEGGPTGGTRRWTGPDDWLRWLKSVQPLLLRVPPLFQKGGRTRQSGGAGRIGLPEHAECPAPIDCALGSAPIISKKRGISGGATGRDPRCPHEDSSPVHAPKVPPIIPKRAGRNTRPSGRRKTRPDQKMGLTGVPAPSRVTEQLRPFYSKRRGLSVWLTQPPTSQRSPAWLARFGLIHCAIFCCGCCAKLREFSGGPQRLPIEREAPSSERLTAVLRSQMRCFSPPGSAGSPRPRSGDAGTSVPHSAGGQRHAYERRTDKRPSSTGNS